MAEQLAKLNKGEMNTYSTSERMTGETWINGKPIYRKVIEFNSQILIASPTTFNNSISYDTGIDASNISEIIDARCIDINGSCWSVPVLGISGNTTLLIINGFARNLACSKLIYEYTKS